ncbi:MULTISPECIES: mycothiol-dependent nitroreductase Rv2466c family protein [unclassified Streptomyces]|uniref:mycothiol-dependent nitroreductase Rv2466c family protein n=1 Tax=Streptomyces sp. NPDC055082 TaxID=3365718 RepID=UPI0037CD219C
MTTEHTDRDQVDFWFDPLCGWTWLAYQWLRQVESVREVSVRLRPTGLALMRARTGQLDVNPQYHELAQGPARVIAAAHALRGDEILAPLYDAVGSRLHAPGGVLEGTFGRARDLSPEDRRLVQLEVLGKAEGAVAAALTEVGLSPDLTEQMRSTQWDGALSDSHAAIPLDGRRIELIGVPVISVNGGNGWFGPVLSAIPAGERAGRLWDGFRLVAAEELVGEMKVVGDRTVPQPRLVF